MIPAPTAHRSQMLASSMSIGDRLRWLMETQRISQVTLAEKIGVTQSAISNIVTRRSRRPSAATLLKLASTLGCSPNWILDGLGDPYARGTSGNENELLLLFKAMNSETQAAVLTIARNTVCA
jgi:transcriptional regulator with XRE-family HTH domain